MPFFFERINDLLCFVLSVLTEKTTTWLQIDTLESHCTSFDTLQTCTCLFPSCKHFLFLLFCFYMDPS